MTPVLLFLVLHLLLGAVLPLPRDPRPLFYTLLANAGSGLGRRLNRDTRPPGDLAFRGFVAVAVVTAFSAIIAYAFYRAAQYPYGWLGGTVFLFFSASLMGPVKLLRAVTDALAKDDTAKAVKLLQPCFPAPLSSADSHTLARRAAEWSAVSLDVHFTAPLFWFLLLGAPGAMLSVTFAALREAFGGHKFFGRFARLLDRLFNIVPALLTAFILMFCAIFVSGCSPRRALETAFSQAGKYKSSGFLGLPVAAMAGALGVTLGGAEGWIGPKDSTARLSAAQLQRCAMIHFVFFLCVTVLVSAGILLENIMVK